jgi:DNA-binding NtrC family response regulator
MESGSANVLCLADSNARLNYVARTLKRAGHRVILSNSAHNAVAIVAVSTNIDLVVIDEDMVVGDGSVAESIKAVKPLPILLVCDNGPSGDLPAGVDLVTANGSRQQVLAGVSKLLIGHRQLKTSA